MRLARTFLPSLLAVSAIVFASAGVCAQSLPEGFAFRRSLHFTQAASDAPGPNAAVAEFYTNGQAKPDGSDLRVTTADRTLVPHRILQISPTDDFVRIAFATRGDGPYYVWWGNAKAQAPATDLDIQRGIYTEILKMPSQAAHKPITPESLEALFAQARPPVGALFVPQIFLGYNPVGPERGAMLHYRGQFKIDKATTASFAFTVANTGALTIDEKIIAREIRSRLHGDARNTKSVDLAVGWHTIDVTQVNLDGEPTAVAVDWKLPADRNYAPMPISIFAPIARAWAGPLEETAAPENTYVADFDITPQAETFCPPDFYFQRYTFYAQYPETFKPAITWDFGDGQSTGELKRVDHVYLTPGAYAVTLTLRQGGTVFHATRRITILDRMYSRFPHPPEDSAKTVSAALKEYLPQKLSSDQAYRGMLYFKGADDDATRIAWGKTWAAFKDAPAGQAVFDEAFDLARLLENRKDDSAAADIFRHASAKPLDTDTRLRLMRCYVITACDHSDDVDAALHEAQGWLKTGNLTPEQGRAVQVTIAYAALAKGDATLARVSLDEAAKAAGPSAPGAYNQAHIRQGVLARDIESYILTKDFDTALKLLDQWDLEFPQALWDGFSRILRVKLAVAEGRPDAAARIALQHARTVPASPYAAELLYRASANFNLAKDAVRSKAALDLLSNRYPESPYARGDAKDK